MVPAQTAQMLFDRLVRIEPCRPPRAPTARAGRRPFPSAQPARRAASRVPRHAACSSSSARILATVVVLPGPGAACHHREPPESPPPPPPGAAEDPCPRRAVRPIPSLNTPRSTAPGERVGTLREGRRPPGTRRTSTGRGTSVVPSRRKGRSSPTRTLVRETVRPFVAHPANGRASRCHRGLCVGVGGPADRLEIHTGVTEARGAHRQGGAEEDACRRRDGSEAAEAARHVDVSGDEHPRFVERAQQAAWRGWRQTDSCFCAEQLLPAVSHLRPRVEEVAQLLDRVRLAGATTRPRTACRRRSGMSDCSFPA